MTALIWAVTSVVVTAMVTPAALRAWREWLDVKRLQFAADRSEDNGENPRLLIEIAAVRERLRNLEEIATGVEL